MLFGERILAIALSNQPTPGAWLTCDLERAEDSYKLCLRAGKARDTWPKRRWGNKRQCQMPAHPPIAPPPLATFGKPSGCGCRSSVPGQAMPRLQDTASPFNASPPAPPAKAAHSQPAASRVTGEATDSPKGVMNAFLWPLPAHRQTSAHICSHLPGGPGRLQCRACRHALGTQAWGRGTAHLLFVFGVVSIAARILVLLPVFAMLAGGQEDNILSVMDVI